MSTIGFPAYVVTGDDDSIFDLNLEPGSAEFVRFMLDQRQILAELKIPLEFDDERRAMLDAVNDVIEASRRKHDAGDSERESATRMLNEGLDALVAVDQDITKNELKRCDQEAG